ncbi:hypothetical protein [Arcobacter sp. s6]|uniref:hypothetical protein n=1 Tax=Arcobacter sp. s6 TaxID=3230363 RepID=UPI00349FF31B
MKILFYVEPLIEQDKPYWKDGWINVFCKKIINTLNQNDNTYNFLIMTNEALVKKVNFDIQIVQLTQKELLSPFDTTNYLDVTTAWHLETYSSYQLEDYKTLMLEKLNGFIPDIIITFSPVPFFKYMFKSTLILHHEYSIFSRLPYPQSWFLDPIGMHSNSFLNKFQDEIKVINLSENQMKLINNFKQSCQNILFQKSPFKNIFDEKRKQFDYLILLPLQFSRYFAFDDLVRFKSQYEYCVYILDNVPSNIGVVVNSHPLHPILSLESVEFLKIKYSNFIYEDDFNTIEASGQFILPFVDAVITVSSSVGLQTLLFDKKLITLSDKTFSFIADATNIDNIEKVLESENIDKNSFLYFILTRYAITEKYLYNSKWIDSFLVKSLNKFKEQNISIDFYDAIDSDENIFKTLSQTIKHNSKFVPQIVNKRFLQLFIEDENGISEESSIKYPVVQNNEIQRFEFNLKNRDNIISLRLDPFNDSCVVEIEKLYIVLKDGDEVDLIAYQFSNTCSRHGKIYFFENFDPQIYFESLDFKTLNNIEKLYFEVKYSHVGKDALHVCVKQIVADKDYKISIIEKENKELKECLSPFENKALTFQNGLITVYTSRSWKITQTFRNIIRKFKKR